MPNTLGRNERVVTLVSGLNGWVYEATTVNLDGGRFEHSLQPQRAVDVHVSFDDAGRLTVKVMSTLPIDDFDEEAATRTARSVVDRLAFETDVPFTDPSLKRSSLASGEGYVYYGIQVTVTSPAPDSETLQALASSHWGSEPEMVSAACRLYREAMHAGDEISSFILYWNLLSALSGGDAQADAAIRDIDPDVRIVTSRKRGKVSIVLDTRDLLAHMRREGPVPDTSPVRACVRDALPFLRRTVRVAVQAVLPEPSGSA